MSVEFRSTELSLTKGSETACELGRESAKRYLTSNVSVTPMAVKTDPISTNERNLYVGGSGRG